MLVFPLPVWSVVPLPSWLRNCVWRVFTRPLWLRHCLSSRLMTARHALSRPRNGLLDTGLDTGLTTCETMKTWSLRFANSSGL